MCMLLGCTSNQLLGLLLTVAALTGLYIRVPLRGYHHVDAERDHSIGLTDCSELLFPTRAYLVQFRRTLYPKPLRVGRRYMV